MGVPYIVRQIGLIFKRYYTGHVDIFETVLCNIQTVVHVNKVVAVKLGADLKKA